MINISLEDGTYYKSQDWCWHNADKYLVEGNPYEWSVQFNLAFDRFNSSDYLKTEKGKNLWDKFLSIAQFFTNLTHQ